MALNANSARQHLAEELRHALAAGKDVDDLVDQVVRAGWSPPQVLIANSERFEGLLEGGERVSIEILHSSAYGFAASARTPPLRS